MKWIITIIIFISICYNCLAVHEIVERLRNNIPTNEIVINGIINLKYKIKIISNYPKVEYITDFKGYLDLSLEYVWWNNIREIKCSEYKGRKTYTVETLAPKESNVHTVKMWIDAKLFVLLKVEMYSKEKELLKKWYIKSLKKKGNSWTIQDIVYQSYFPYSKTILKVF